jgi:hypothetical protein
VTVFVFAPPQPAETAARAKKEVAIAMLRTPTEHRTALLPLQASRIRAAMRQRPI